MNKRIRNNKFSQAPMDIILVGSGDQALATGALNTTGSTLNLADNQLGVLSEDDHGTIVPENFITAGTTAVDVKSIRPIQGTPNSTQLQNVSPFGVNDPAFVPGGIIDANKITRVVTSKPEIGVHDLQILETFTAPVVDTEYKLTITLESHKRDLAFTPQKRDQVVGLKRTAVSAPTAPTDWILQNLAYEVNKQSLLVESHRPFVVLGVNKAGGAGTVIGTGAAGDVVNFQTDGVKTYSITLTTQMINTLSIAVGVDAALATSTIEVLDLSTAGAAAKVDTLLVLGLDEPFAFAFDDSLQTKVRVEAATNLVEATRAHLADAKEESGDGRKWFEKWRKRMGLYLHDLSYVGHDYDITTSKLTNYVDQSLLYTSTIIEFFGKEETMTISQTSPHTLTFLLPAAISNPTADVNTGYTVATSDSTTVTQLNASLGAWMSNASDNFSGINYEDEATKAAPFV